MYLKYYLEKLGYKNMPEFLVKYLKTPSLVRLKKVGYFCGMDYASKDIYDFKEYISRYDHSLSVCLLTYKLTGNKRASLAGLFHDIATPCFSHVIDYMNEDYERQESTEEYTEIILKNDKYLNDCLALDGIDLSEICDFKKFSIVDNERPKLCADRLDGVILTGIAWTKNIDINDIDNIIDDIVVFKNELLEDEIGFKTLDTALKVLKVNESIDTYCHSYEDNYMMDLLAKITKKLILKEYITYEDLYILNEEELIDLFKRQKDLEIKELINKFFNIKKEEIPKISIGNVKVRKLTPLVNKERIK